MKNKLLIIFLMLAFAGTSACAPAAKVSDAAVSPEPAETTPAPAPLYTATVNAPAVYGSSHAILSALFDDLKDINGETALGFMLGTASSENRIDAVLIGQTCYAVVDGLSPESDYTLGAWVETDGETNLLGDTLTFSTPACRLSTDEVDQMISGVLADEDILTDNQLLLETQACLRLMALE